MIIGLGTAAIGRPHYINIKTSTNKAEFNKTEFISKGIKILSYAYENGVRHFDTAPGYGIAEEVILKWIELDKPKDITISTKWGYTYVANFDLNATIHEVKEHSLTKLNKQWEFSKQLLPYLNIYQIHSATFESGVLNNKEVLNRLFEIKKEHGMKIGLSVSGEDQNKIIEKALDINVNDSPLFDSFQITYNVFDQSLLSIINRLKNKTIIIKEALANGRVFPNANYPQHDKTYFILNNLASKYNVGIDAIAMSFINQTISAYSILSGAAAKSHITSNLKAEKVKLSSDEISLLKKQAVKPNQYWNERKRLVWN